MIDKAMCESCEVSPALNRVWLPSWAGERLVDELFYVCGDCDLGWATRTEELS